MFKSKTVFIVGAGASAEVGLPVGAQLKLKIAEALRLDEQRGYSASFSDLGFSSVLINQLRRAGLNEALPACMTVAKLIASNMPLAKSIDNFLHTHNDNTLVKLCGKVAIVRCILQAEHDSGLYVDPAIPNASLNQAGVAGSWFNRLAQVLFENVTQGDLERVFENVSFITFNYDRCIEMFLQHALHSYFDISLETAHAMVNALTIIHPYGAIDRLPPSAGGKSIPFGFLSPPDDYDVDSHIRTFTERMAQGSELELMRQEIQGAQVIIFLGFAFHPLNMELLAPAGSSDAQRVFGTAMGLSPFERQFVKNDIAQTLKKGAPIDLQEKRCVGLFDYLGTGLSRL